jgi:tetratricopeptide (TPR) repeat protein
MEALEAPVRRLVEARMAQIKATPADGRAHALLGAVYSANGLPLPAAESFAQAAAIDAAEPLWPYYQARALRALGRDAEARESFERALAIDAEFAPAHLALGWVRFDEGETTAAHASIERACSLAPDRPEPWIALATLTLDAERPQEARAHARRALELQPTSGHARFVLGAATVALGDVERGRAEMRAGADSDSTGMQTAFSIELARAKVNRADTLSSAAQLAAGGRAGEALAILDKLLEDFPRDAMAHSNRGSVLDLMGRGEEAVVAYAAALDLDEHLERTWKNLAQLQLRLANMPEARRAAERALALDDTLAEAHAVRSIALRRGGDPAGAVVAVRRAIALDPGQSQLLPVLAAALIDLQRYDEARATIARARDMNAALPGLDQLLGRIEREAAR